MRHMLRIQVTDKESKRKGRIWEVHIKIEEKL